LDLICEKGIDKASLGEIDVESEVMVHPIYRDQWRFREEDEFGEKDELGGKLVILCLTKSLRGILIC